MKLNLSFSLLFCKIIIELWENLKVYVDNLI